MTAQRLIDTRHPSDACLLGYDRAVDPSEDGEGLIVTREADGWVTLQGPDGEVRLCPKEALELGKSLTPVSGRAAA